ncbi:MAG TPA: tetratricopeptide repeat protein [Syntrophorhabdaceae bacterium]|nr:tetratricopeptide repeat protein [Syntrophorhabdaceae bacterium]
MNRFKSLFQVVIFLISLCLLSPLYASGEEFLEKGMKEFKEENYEESLAYFQDARKADPTSSIAAYYLGLTYKILEDHKSATPHLKDAVTLTPKIKEALVELIDSLYQIGNLKEAKEWIDVGEKEGIQPARVQFLKGLILSKEGKYMDAVAAFEKAKSLDPSMAQAAEFQIASAYTKEGKLKEAQKRFRSTISLDPTTDMATYAKDYEKMVAEKIERERPWRFSIGLNYKYDTNVVAKGSGQIVDAISGHEGSALNLSLRLGYTFPFSFKTPFNLSLQYSLFAERYFPKQYTRADGTTGDLSEYNNMSNVLSAIPGYNFEKWSLSFPITYMYNSLQADKRNSFLGDLNWWNQTRYLEQYGITPTARFMVTKNSVGEVSFGIAKKRYFETPLHPEPFTSDENRNAFVWNTGLGWTYFFKGGKGIFSLKYTFNKEEADGRNWSIDYENRFSLTFLYPLYDFIKRPIKFLASADASFTQYKFENATFNMKRRNDTYNLSASLIYEGLFANIFKGRQSQDFMSDLLKNTDLIGQYTYIRDKCNISIYDYKRELITLGLEYKF